MFIKPNQIEEASLVSVRGNNRRLRVRLGNTVLCVFCLKDYIYIYISVRTGNMYYQEYVYLIHSGKMCNS